MATKKKKFLLLISEGVFCWLLEGPNKYCDPSAKTTEAEFNEIFYVLA